MKQLIFALLTLLIAPLTVSAAEAAKFEEGVNYQLISPAVPTADSATIEVVEMFWYGCPHCFHFEPLVTEWLKTKPADVSFRRVPAIFAEQWKPHARALYAAEALGSLEKLHKPLFDAIHVEKRRIFDEFALMQFVTEVGFDADEFKAAYESPTVEAKVKMATLATRDYGIDGVPAVIVNGKYRTNASMAGSQEAMLDVVNFLIAKERAK